MFGTQMQLEPLESRRLMSITATTFFGPPTIGTKWTYDAIAPGGVKSTHQISVTGIEKVAGAKTIHLETSQKLGGTRVVGSAYDTVDDVKGVVQYKAQTTTINGKHKTSVNTIFDPPAVSCPAKLTAGKTYRYTWRSSTDTVIGTVHQKMSSTRTYTVKLLSDTPVKIKVPAGTFSAYRLQTTVTTSVAGSSSTSTNNLWVAPGVGMVKSTTSSNGTNSRGELTSFRAGKTTRAYIAPPVARQSNSRLIHSLSPAKDSSLL